MLPEESIDTPPMETPLGPLNDTQKRSLKTGGNLTSWALNPTSQGFLGWMKNMPLLNDR